MKSVKLFLLLVLAALFTNAQTIAPRYTQPMSYDDYSVRGSMNIGSGKTKYTPSSSYLALGDSLYSRKGLLFPRGNKDSVLNAERGLVFFDIPSGKLQVYNGTAWQELNPSSATVFGTGTGGYTARWNSGTSLSVGALRDDGTNISVGIAPSVLYRMYVSGNSRFTGSMFIDGLSGSDEKMLTLSNTGLVQSRSFANIPLSKDTVASIVRMASFNSVADLMASDYYAKGFSQTFTLGYYNNNDGGAATYIWNAASTATPDTAFVVKPSSVSGAGRWLLDVSSRELNLLQIGAKSGDITFDNARILRKALAYPTKLNIVTPAPANATTQTQKTYYFLDTLRLDGFTHISGGGSLENPTAYWQFTVVNKPSITVPYGASAKMEHLYLLQSDPLNWPLTWSFNKSAHFFNIQGKFDFYNLFILSASGDGFHISASENGDGAPVGNSNACRLVNCTANNCTNGLFVNGRDANLLEIKNFNGTLNRHTGVYGSALIGSYYDQLHLAFNGTVTSSNAAFGAKSDVVVRYSGKMWQAINPLTTTNLNKTPSSEPNYWMEIDSTLFGTSGVYSWSADSTYFGSGAVLFTSIAPKNILNQPYVEDYSLPGIISSRSLLLNPESSLTKLVGGATISVYNDQFQLAARNGMVFNGDVNSYAQVMNGRLQINGAVQPLRLNSTSNATQLELQYAGTSYGYLGAYIDGFRLLNQSGAENFYQDQSGNTTISGNLKVTPLAGTGNRIAGLDLNGQFYRTAIDPAKVFLHSDTVSTLATQWYVNNLQSEGTYLPTLSSATNLSSSSSFSTTNWSRNGNTVTVFGKIGATPTASGTCKIALSLPITSGFASDDNAAGTATATAVNEPATIYANTSSTDKAWFEWTAAGTTARTYFFQVTYKILPQ